MVQKSRRIVPALSRADIALTQIATVLGPEAKLMKNLAASMKIGLPGGCPTSNLLPWAINSPQSQKLAVGSMVRR